MVEAKWPKLGPSKIQKNARIGIASDFWNRYEEDILLAKDIGPTSTRFPCSLTPMGRFQSHGLPLQGTYRFEEAILLGTKGLPQA